MGNKHRAAREDHSKSLGSPWPWTGLGNDEHTQAGNTSKTNTSEGRDQT